MVLHCSEHYSLFKEITIEGERAELYENTRMIGFKQSWRSIIAQKGYTLIEGRLVKSSHKIDESVVNNIDRHKTAIVRNSLSAPIKTLAKNSYLDGNYSIFDYGCGLQDDLRKLQTYGIDALGWDPNFCPDNDKIVSDIVNLGFVLNVIENQDERLDALLDAWALTSKILVVSVMLASDSFTTQFKAFNDGIITSRNTFQKYYTQSEIKYYLERSLQENCVAVAPGIFYIFKDKQEEQKYQQKRYAREHKWLQQKSTVSLLSKDKSKLLITKHFELFSSFWRRCLELGRIPATHEFEYSEQISELLGSHLKIFNLVKEIFDFDEFEKAQRHKQEDLLLYFAMGLFENRKPYKQQSETLKRDITALFNNYKSAIDFASGLLFTISNTELINEQCEKAHAFLPASLLNKGHSLILHRDFIDDLPIILRIYVGAALQIYGELDEHIDLIKIHTTSGKLTLTAYDNFDHSVPFLVERIKINMAEQEIEFFDYVDDKRRPPLLNKNLYISSTHQDFKKQQSFDKRLAKLMDFETNGECLMQRVEFDTLLERELKKIDGHSIRSL